jgi:hypothetical protein
MIHVPLRQPLRIGRRDSGVLQSFKHDSDCIRVG